VSSFTDICFILTISIIFIVTVFVTDNGSSVVKIFIYFWGLAKILIILTVVMSTRYHCLMGEMDTRYCSTYFIITTFIFTITTLIDFDSVWMSETVVEENGTKWWYKNGELHREGGLPAVVGADGTKWWYKNNQLHREGGLPAIEGAFGKSWWYNGKKHREGGLPAIESADGTKEWWYNGLRHRDGELPAIEYANGNRWWYRNGKLHRVGGPAIIYDHDPFWYFEGYPLTEDQHDFIFRMHKRSCSN
jgi:hypothetical protein